MSRSSFSSFDVGSLRKSKDFSNGLKNPTDNAFAVGFFYPLGVFFSLAARPLCVISLTTNRAFAARAL
jgi:hypothetical protein